MITEKRLEEALKYLSETDEDHAKLLYLLRSIGIMLQIIT
jgi:hypothetical protein